MAQVQHPVGAQGPAAHTGGATGATGDTGPAAPAAPQGPIPVIHVIMRKGTVGLDKTMSIPAEQADDVIMLEVNEQDPTTNKTTLVKLTPKDVQARVEALLHRLIPPEEHAATGSAAAKK